MKKYKMNITKKEAKLLNRILRSVYLGEDNYKLPEIVSKGQTKSKVYLTMHKIKHFLFNSLEGMLFWYAITMVLAYFIINGGR